MVGLTVSINEETVKAITARLPKAAAIVRSPLPASISQAGTDGQAEGHRLMHCPPGEGESPCVRGSRFCSWVGEEGAGAGAGGAGGGGCPHVCLPLAPRSGGSPAGWGGGMPIVGPGGQPGAVFAPWPGGGCSAQAERSSERAWPGLLAVAQVCGGTGGYRLDPQGRGGRWGGRGGARQAQAGVAGTV